MQPPIRGIKHDAHRHFRIVSGSGAKGDETPRVSELKVDSHRSPAADEAKSSLSLQGREKSQVRNELTALISTLCTEGMYAMVACRSDLRHIVPATIRADADMTQVSCCFGDGTSAWLIPIPTIEEIITGPALNVEFPLTLTENLLAKTCAIRSKQLEDIIIMCETPVDKRKFVSALSLFIMLPNKLSARVPLIDSSSENAGTEWAPSPRRSSDGDDRIVLDQSPIGAFAEAAPEPKSMLSVIPESAGSTEKKNKRRDRRSSSKKPRKSRRSTTPNHSHNVSRDRRRAEGRISLPIPTRAPSQAPPPPTRPRTARGREPSHRMPSGANGTVQTVPPRASSQNARLLSHRARPVSTRSPSPYLRARRREYNMPPMPGVYSLDNPMVNWNGPRAARPPRLGEGRGFMVPDLTCCNFCEHREESILDRMTLRRVMAPIPGIGESWNNATGESALSDGKRLPAGRSNPSTRMTASQLDITDNLPSPRHFEPPSARFGRVMPETNKVSQIVGYRSPVSYLPRSASASTPRQPSSRRDQFPKSNGIISSTPLRRPPMTSHVPVTTMLMSYSTDSSETPMTNSQDNSIKLKSRSLSPVLSQPTTKKKVLHVDRSGEDGGKPQAIDTEHVFSESDIPPEAIAGAKVPASDLSSPSVKMRKPPAIAHPEIKTRDCHSSDGSVPALLEARHSDAPAEFEEQREDRVEQLDMEKTPRVEGILDDSLEQNRQKMLLTPNRLSARTDGRSKATGFTAFFDRELSESTWQPDITDKENTLTLLYAKQLDAKPHQRPAPVSAVKEEEETFSISASQVVPRPFKNRNTSTSQLREGSVWRSDLGHKQMTPLEKLKTANLGFPTPFTAAISKRQESSEANMMEHWSRSRL